jgi:hydrogenase-4 component B
VISALLLTGLCIWAFGAGVDLTVGAGPKVGQVGAYGAGLVGSACIGAAGVSQVLGAPTNVDLGATLGVGETLLRLDGLAGLFLTLTGALGVVVSACLLDWSAVPGRIRGHGTGAGYLLLLGSVTVVIVAGDAFTFLFAWESLTVAFYILTGVRRERRPTRRSAWVTFGVGKMGGAALLVGFLLLASRSGTYTLSAWAHVAPGTLHNEAYALVVAGFAAKVGLIPLQVWMPVGYPAAPGPTRAAMAGLAVNVGFYGLWRFLGLLGRPPVALVVVVLLVGGITALLGIAFACVQASLARVIAYSSVENAGMIAVAYGIALAGAYSNQPRLTAVGLLAASLQVLAHAVAKTGLFTSEASITSDWATDRLDELRGVGRTHPWAATTFGLGALTLSGLPPTIGFASEWFILEAIMQEFRVGSLGLRLAMAAAGALVALTVGLAALTFIRLLGLTILSRPAGYPAPERAERPGVAGRFGLATLAASCLGLAAVLPWVMRFLAEGLSPVAQAAVVRGALKSPWVLQPVYADFSALSPSWLFVVMPIGFLAVAGFAFVASRGSIVQVRRVPAWRSATAGVAGADRYSSFGYANVLRHVLGNVLGTRRSRVMVEDLSESRTGESSDARTVHVESVHVEVRSTVVEPIETYLYRPVGRAFLRVVRASKRLQSGELSAYVAYMLVTLLIVLAVAAAWD